LRSLIKSCYRFLAATVLFGLVPVQAELPPPNHHVPFPKDEQLAGFATFTTARSSSFVFLLVVCMLVLLRRRLEGGVGGGTGAGPSEGSLPVKFVRSGGGGLSPVNSSGHSKESFGSLNFPRRKTGFWFAVLPFFAAAVIAQGRQIDWYSAASATNLTSQGAVMDGTFVFELGVFAGSFVPTSSNTADWKANWRPAPGQRRAYDPLLKKYSGTILVEEAYPGFSEGKAAYVWGFNAHGDGKEWILFRGDTWEWPAPDPLNPTPLEWQAVAANQVVVGSVMDSGTPHLMRTVRIENSEIPPSNWEEWQAVALAGEASNAPGDDPDDDGCTNLQEFVFGTDPLVAGPCAGPTIDVMDLAPYQYTRMTIPRRRDRLANLWVEVSVDLQNWFANGDPGGPFTVTFSDTTASWVVRDLTPLSPEQPRRFLRMGASLGPGNPGGEFYLDGYLGHAAPGHSLFQWAPMHPSPPTITESASSSIASPQIIDPTVGPSGTWDAAKLAQCGARGADWYRRGNPYMEFRGVTNGGIYGSLLFDTNASEIEFVFNAISVGRRFFLYVDGQLATPLPGKLTTGGAFQPRYMKIDFGSSAMRRIMIPCPYLGFYELRTNAGASVTPVASPRCIVAGDSFTEGTGSNPALGFASLLAHKFGWDVWASGLGGTGYVRTNGSRTNLLDRLNTDIIAHSPDILIYAMGINDFADPMVGANAAACYDAVAAALPNCRQIVMGPFWPNAPYSASAKTVANRAAIKAEAEARKIPFVDLHESDTAAWITTANKQTYHPNVNVAGTPTVTAGAVTAISTAGGGVFGQVPNVEITGGGGTGATATATTTGRLVGATLIEGGGGYTTASVTVGGDGSGGAFTATLSEGRITGLTLTNEGSGYTYPPPITITGDGRGAFALVGWGLKVTAMNVTNGGSGYTSPPTVKCSPADATHPPMQGHIYYAERLAYELQRLRNP
jgi:hypothetical protein